ncbi:mannosyltransferase family protein [Effusibacillus pohliae]|uniref:mannosyltransferase family protein n=1 Tax=Effusibacillus pohliae TaxID=232270 RepID=UPI00037A3D71|nr:mannosyltransferase family protein [Effusibacillus pohliae]
MTERKARLYTFALFFLHKCIVLGASFVFVRKYVSLPDTTAYVKYALLDNFVRWDALWYIRIAHEGYGWQQPAAFFPLYPYLMRGLHDAFGMSYRLAGLLVANIAFLFALYLLVRLLSLDYSRIVVIRTVMLLIVFPASFYFTAVYTESLFLFWTVGCFYFLRQRMWGWAGVFGFFASLTRNTGTLLMLPFLYEYLAARDFQWRRVRADLLWITLPIAGILSYMLLLYKKIGDPLAFVHAQQYWSRTFRWPWATVWRGTWDVLTRPRHGWPRLNRIYEAITAYWELALTGLSFWQQRLRLRWSYSLYMLAAVVVPLLSPSPVNSYFYSIPRFVIVIFPLFIVWALLLRHKVWLAAVMLLCTAGQWYLLDKFTGGLFVF